MINEGLLELEAQLEMQDNRLADFPTMPQPKAGHTIPAVLPDLIRAELNYDREALAAEVTETVPLLNREQPNVYETVRAAVFDEEPQNTVFFLDGLGGTGKTFIYNLLVKSVRAKEKTALAVASSGIAAMLVAAILLDGGQTAHKAYKIPIPIHQNAVCGIKFHSAKAELLRQAQLIIWDEAPMSDRRNVEAVSETLKELMKTSINSDRPFGGKVVLLGGDFKKVFL